MAKNEMSDTFCAEKDALAEQEEASIVQPLQTVDLADSISDSGKFAYSALCAASLNQLFDTDGLFKAQVLDSLIAHLKQPEQVKSSICAIADGHGGETADPFVEALMKEAAVDADAVVVVEDFIKLILKSGYYDSRMRVLTKHMTFLLRVTSQGLEDCEERILHELKEAEHHRSDDEINEEKKAQRNKKAKRYLMIGLATVGGGALIGLTGGLAAPFVAAGAGAVIGGAGAAALGTATGIYVIGSLFGVAGAGLTGYRMKKRVGAIEQFEFMPIAESSQLHVTIAIAGWLTKDEGDFALPWRSLAHSKEQYCLKWESSYLLEMGQAIQKIVDSMMTMAAQEALKYTVLSGILTAIAWPASLIALSGIIDNPWSVCLRRSQQVGHELANVLLSRQQGRRPVSLIGFSLGARVIYYCLEEMAKRKGCEGIIEDVYIFGTPVSADAAQWEKFQKVVAGKITNGYCKADWLLKFLYRTSSAQMKIAGLHPIKWDNRRMCNIDLSDVVEGHTDYANKMDEILSIVGVPTKEAPKRITQLRLHPSWSKDNVRSPSSSSLRSNHSNGGNSSPGKRSPNHSNQPSNAPSNQASPSREVDVAKDRCGLKRLTDRTGEADVEFAEDAWDMVLRSEYDKNSSALESMRVIEKSRKESLGEKTVESSDTRYDTDESSSLIISPSESRDSCIGDMSEFSQATDNNSLATDDVSIVTADDDVTIAEEIARLAVDSEATIATSEDESGTDTVPMATDDAVAMVATAEGDNEVDTMTSSTDSGTRRINWVAGTSERCESPKIKWEPIK